MFFNSVVSGPVSHMAPRAVWLLVALSGVLTVCSCWAYTCPAICRCSADTFQCSRDTQLATRAGATSVPRLRLTHLTLKEVPTHAFKELINITIIEISQSDCITKIQRHAFLSLRSLTQISVQNINSLRVIEKEAFTDLPKLEYLSISNTGVIHFPDFTTISSLAPNIILEMADNMRIDVIPANSFQGITEEYVEMNLIRNSFKEIKSHAFNGTKLNTLILRDNRYLSYIQEDAFEGATGPSLLDVSSTALSSLPPKGLRQVRFLKASSAFALKALPPLESLAELLEAELTYPSHCCAFHTWRRKQRESALKNFTKLCDLSETETEPTADGVNLFDDINFQYPDLEFNCLNNPFVKCTPKPDAFNPCEDLLGFPVLRCLTWIITVFAVAGNLAVLVILLISHHKLTISRFLMCNLAFADLCMGLYLMLIAFMDYYSRHKYYNHATDWQTGHGCGIAGFLTVFSSELSVYTLTVISLERWHTITNAMHVNKRLRMQHVTAMMGAGWGLSLLVSLLPLVGVSSYSKVSICLPMDIDTPASQVYVVAVLIFNVVAFLVVCYCYICIFLSVHNPEHSTHHGDTKIAKRMAVLIFTDFLCMAPISFFAISAALRMPLITVSNSKILLILFYPINSLCNPFLYTLFTRAFRKDVRLLLSRCGCCHANTDFYRSQTLASHLNSTQKTSTRKHHSHSFYAYHIKMKGCFLNKGAT
ncbi:lutropin-choriogonadotropic hormone receptor-like isoform X1 [Micropterus dolomieu]|uniref:lutropin-choriogonadotropic hormone receptor-like isoform X1 n=1 Tax=Micropterus dolomieu TaxID=147949 RepID=UPI001E8CAF41|nr:lutropin-choriogonadotropic hormone receptor-like isoform X1 [Micropterus dolomieu]